MVSNQVRNKFIEYLRYKKQRVTNERLIVLENLLTQPGHIDADNLFIYMKTKGLKISRATIYNTLQLLVDSQIITKSNFGEQHQHYEQAINQPQHYHLVCSMCGSVIEFEDINIEKIKKNVCKINNFSATECSFQIIGTCHKCSKAN